MKRAQPVLDRTNCGTSKGYASRGQLAGFTLIELLVVLAIMGIMASMVLPALARARLRAQAASCVNGKRQLLAAWLLFSQDHNDLLVPNYPDGDPGGWVGGWLCWVGSHLSDNTNQANLTDSLLGPYTAKQTRIYRCPSDRSCGYGQTTERVRSVSMNAFMGDPGPKFPPPDYIYSGWRQFARTSDIRNPTGIFVFLDEHPDSINDGWFIYCTTKKPPETSEWSDLPASYHNKGGCFVFADGHSEIHKWTGSGILKPNVMNGMGGSPLRASPARDDQQDIIWVRDRSTYKSR